MCPRLPRPLLLLSRKPRGSQQKAAHVFRPLPRGLEARLPAGSARNRRSGRSRTERAAKVLAAARMPASGVHSTARTIQTGPPGPHGPPSTSRGTKIASPAPRPRRMRAEAVHGARLHARARIARPLAPNRGLRAAAKASAVARTQPATAARRAASLPRVPRATAPRKTFSKPGTFGRKREGGFAGKPGFGGGDARPPRRDFGGSDARPPRRDFGGPADAASGPRWRLQAARLVYASTTWRLRQQAAFQRPRPSYQRDGAAPQGGSGQR